MRILALNLFLVGLGFCALAGGVSALKTVLRDREDEERRKAERFAVEAAVIEQRDAAITRALKAEHMVAVLELQRHLSDRHPLPTRFAEVGAGDLIPPQNVPLEPARLPPLTLPEPVQTGGAR